MSDHPLRSQSEMDTRNVLKPKEKIALHFTSIYKLNIQYACE